MIVNVRVKMSNEERNTLAVLIDNKESKRLATRKEVIDFLAGCMDAALMQEEARQVNFDEDAEVKKLQKLKYNDSYIRGWLNVGRSLQ